MGCEHLKELHASILAIAIHIALVVLNIPLFLFLDLFILIYLCVLLACMYVHTYIHVCSRTGVTDGCEPPRELNLGHWHEQQVLLTTKIPF